MDPSPSTPSPLVTIERRDVPTLFEALTARGYQVIGPTVRDGAIVYDRLAGPDDLPAGWTEVQAGAQYRLARRRDQALFGYAVGPRSWKPFLMPPATTVWQGRRTTTGFSPVKALAPPSRCALLGVRACDLKALQILDTVFLRGAFVDPSYAQRRERLFLVAVHCTQPGGTCFCASMGTGPRANAGYDLAWTEVLEPSRHYFVAEAGTARGAAVLCDVSSAPTTAAERDAAARRVTDAAGRMGRTVETADLPALLARQMEHPRWDDVAARCLSCGNCTAVCPTCFCTAVTDAADLAGAHAQRRRTWDSCFTLGFSYLHGGSVRVSTKARYRQWLLHKFSTWRAQFGTFGCVGCGRCITWCPAGIDVTEELRALRVPSPTPSDTTQEAPHAHP